MLAQALAQFDLGFSKATEASAAEATEVTSWGMASWFASFSSASLN
jgi:hypothetical protein